MQRALRLLPRHLIKTVLLSERRCYNCNHRLCDADIKEGTVEIKCGRCGQINYIVGSAAKKED